MSQIVNIAGYQFVNLDRLPERRETLLNECRRLGIKGTILLSPEGINLFLAASRTDIDAFLSYLKSDDRFKDFSVKESFSDEQPFNRLLVRLKKEIIAFGVDGIEPRIRTSPKLKPVELKKWLDEGTPVTLLDVRNNYEVKLGTFQDAVVADIDHFRQFPDAVSRLHQLNRKQPVVMFCTGGIRCEKAGPFMEQAGFESIYQLDGGILQYFEDVGGEHYDGDCFVFDQRVALDPDLKETDAEVCFACQSVLTSGDLESVEYVAGESCPSCFQSAEQIQSEITRQRRRRIQEVAQPLPGSLPYDNYRPLNVPRRFNGWTVIDFLSDYHAHIGRETWQSRVEAGYLVCNHEPLAMNDQVREGQRIEYLLPATVEPDVNADIQIIHEDQWLLVVNKPAPLPMHPSGRFNRNTLTWILNEASDHPLRAAHRLDANTTGVVVFAKTGKTASFIQPQFENQTVNKTYIARVHGIPAKDQFSVEAPITDQPTIAGGRRCEPGGKQCLTEFSVQRQSGDAIAEAESSMVVAKPGTGRTNQIRIHLWQSDHPIVGDPTYLPDRKMAEKQTLGLHEPPMCLHAWKLELIHPVIGLPIEFEAPLPDWART